MPSTKSHYSIEEAADLLNCKLRDLIHLAVQEKITLLVGVPDNVRLQTYDASDEQIEAPALLEPQLLALRQSHCLQIELNGKTKQSDFREGYLINPSGQLQKLMPSYGKPKLNHLWAYWRTYDGPFSTKIELVPERLFIAGEDLKNLLQLSSKDEHPAEITRLAAVPRNKSSQFNEKKVHAPAERLAETANDKNETVAETLTDHESSPPTPAQTNSSKSLSQKPPTIIRLKQVLERTGLSRSTIYDKINPKSPRYDLTFPKQVSLGIGSVGWYESELICWIESRKPADSV